ncbi:mitochondrial carrier [Cylindrobasidium torrendii FP15055 ss-10]|uniref:Mitochondrial carrier n=1 Tax=Cylindrobasidium torrendii FP15055 ss-10 TaxID=1314674 RepID=A0A0D7BPW3_9AGAR|nr:mitochondrial carrier [Cylindrobasidium torrendii FP15055 ss-10]
MSSSPTFVHSLLAGGAAGTAVDVLFFPIDTIKTRLQSSRGFFASGGFKSIYSGIGSVALGSSPGAATFFVVYDSLKKTFSQHTSMPAPTVHLTAASVGEVAACLVRVPTEVVKTRTQTAQYSSSWAALRGTSLKGLYRGFGITVFREIPFTSIQFPLYEYLKQQNVIPFALCGATAGGTAAALTTPLDVLKTRIMLSKTKTTVPAVCAEIMRTGGPKAFFAGVIPRTMWISAGGAVFLGVYELVHASLAPKVLPDDSA